MYHNAREYGNTTYALQSIQSIKKQFSNFGDVIDDNIIFDFQEKYYLKISGQNPKIIWDPIDFPQKNWHRFKNSRRVLYSPLVMTTTKMLVS